MSTMIFDLTIISGKVCWMKCSMQAMLSTLVIQILKDINHLQNNSTLLYHISQNSSVRLLITRYGEWMSKRSGRMSSAKSTSFFISHLNDASVTVFNSFSPKKVASIFCRVLQISKADQCSQVCLNLFWFIGQTMFTIKIRISTLQILAYQFQQCK